MTAFNFHFGHTDGGVCLGRKQASLWAAGQECRQEMPAAGGKPRLDGCLVTVVNNLSLYDNQNCEASTVAIDDSENNNMVFWAVATLRHEDALASLFSDACKNCITTQEFQLSEF